MLLLGNMLNATIDYILQLNEDQQNNLKSNEHSQNEYNQEEEDEEEISALADNPPSINKSNQISFNRLKGGTSQKEQDKDEEEKRNKEMIDQLLAEDLQKQWDAEDDKLVQQNKAIQQDIQLNRQSSKNNNTQPQRMSEKQITNSVSSQPRKNSQSQLLKPDAAEQIMNKGEQVVKKVGGFFKNMVNKIEEKLDGQKKNSINEESKEGKTSEKQQRTQVNTQSQSLQQQKQSAFQQPIMETPYQEATPKKHSRNEVETPTEIIEEIVFHHPYYTSPSTYYNSLVNVDLQNSNTNKFNAAGQQLRREIKFDPEEFEQDDKIFSR